MNVKEAIYKQALRLETLSIKRGGNPDVFNVSELGHCRRQLYLKKRGEKDEIVADTDMDRARICMLFNDGHLHQRAITEYIMQAPNIHITNIENDRCMLRTLENGRSYIIVGHPDGIIHDMKEGKTAVLEIKGLSRFVCKPFKGNGAPLEDENIDSLKRAYPSAILQTLIYMHEDMFNTDYGVIIVKNKDNSELFQFTLEREDKRVNKMLERVDNLVKAIIDSNMPECDFVKGDKDTKYCPFKEYCGG